MKIRLTSIALLGLAALVAVSGCDFQRGRSVTAPTTNAASTSSAAGLLGTWVSESTTAGTSTPTLQGCSTFQWNVTSQTASSASGTFTVTCTGPIVLTGNASAQVTGTTVPMSVTGSGNLPGIGACAFTLTGTGTMIDADHLKVPYMGTTCLGSLSGTVTLRRDQVPSLPTPPTTTPTPDPTPTPPPAPPPPTPTPTPPPPTVNGSELDMNQAIIMNSPRDMASWSVSTRITRLELRSNGVHVEFSKRDGSGRWPDVFPPGWDEPLQYTLGMCENIGGQWYCSAVIQFWAGLDAAGGGPGGIQNNWFYDPGRWGPMSSHALSAGETVGFFVCEGDCRNNTTGSTSPLRERSNVVLIQMPGSGGGTFTF